MSAKRRTADVDVPLSIEEKAALIEEFAMVIPKTLGPGDGDDVDRGAPGEATGPLGPGDDDPRSTDRGTPAPVRGPLAPGETDPHDKVDRNFRMLAQGPAGPGQTHAPRRITVFPNETKE